MTSAAEASTGQNQLASSIGSGLGVLSLNQTVNFTLYVKLILPIDGFVFWVNANLLSDSALIGAAKFNKTEIGANVVKPALPPTQIVAQGSLHYATEIIQNQDQTAARNHIVFTTQSQIQDFNAVNPNFMYIASFEETRFAFSRSGNYYKQASVYHYHGDAIYSIMDSQIIETIADLDVTDVIASNSLPFWLSLNEYFNVYPSFLSEQNSALPYATVHIDPKSTQALAGAPFVNSVSSHYQLVQETVKIEIYGIKNAAALEYHDYINNYSVTTDNFGVMNMPVMQDEHVTQKELGIKAMKKTITFEISYYQQNVLDIAKKMITSAFITTTP
jgi:hypothetical protein